MYPRSPDGTAADCARASLTNNWYVYLYLRSVAAVTVAVCVSATAVATRGTPWKLGLVDNIPVGALYEAHREHAPYDLRDPVREQYLDVVSAALTWRPLLVLALVGAVVCVVLERRRRRS